MAKSKPLYKQLVEQLGTRRGFRVMVFIQLWCMFMLAHDRPPKNIEEFSEELVGVSVATAYRWLHDYREATGLQDPTGMVELVWEHLNERRALTGKDLKVVGV
jgi:hypothetical protein